MILRSATRSILLLLGVIIAFATAALLLGMPAATFEGPAGLGFILYGVVAWWAGRLRT